MEGLMEAYTELLPIHLWLDGRLYIYTVCIHMYSTVDLYMGEKNGDL